MILKAGDLFKKHPALVMAIRRPGCILCRQEAASLSTLKPILDKSGICLYGVIHEIEGVEGFKPYFTGEIYYDEEVSFIFSRNSNL